MKTLIMSKSPDGKVAFLTGGAAVSAAPASGEVEGVTFLLRFAVCSKPDRWSIAVMVLVAGHSVSLFVSSRRARSFRAPQVGCLKRNSKICFTI